MPEISADAVTDFNVDQMELHLRTLRPGVDLTTAKWNFQAFDDSSAKRRFRDLTFYDTLYDALPWMKSKARQGCGIFITVNAMHGELRGVEHCKAAWAWWIDWDHPDGTPPDLPLTSGLRIQTSRGCFHNYILGYTEDLAVWKQIQQALVDRFGCDSNCKDIARVLRLAGTWHQKNPEEPWQVRIEYADGTRYTLAEVQAAIPTVEAVERDTPTSSADSGPQPDDVLIAQIMSGKNYHGAELILAARYVQRGMTREAIINTLTGLQKGNGDDSARAKSRLTEIKALVDGAFKKNFAPLTAGPIRVLIEEHTGEREELLKTVAKQVAESNVGPADRAAIIDALQSKTKFTKKVITDELATHEEADDGDFKETHAGYATKALEAIQAESGGIAAVGAESQLWANVDGIWVPRDAGRLRGLVADMFDGMPRCERGSDYAQITQHMLIVAGADRSDFFEQAPVGVASRLGFHRLVAGDVVLEELRPEHRQRTLAPAPIEGPLTMWLRFLHTSFASKTDGECEAQIAMLQEIFGAVMLGIMARYEKAVLFYGPGRSGKGTAAKVLERLIEDSARCAVSPMRWQREYFLATLAGKRLNIVGELPDDQSIPASDFKSVIGRDSLEGRHPNHRPFTFRNSAAHVFSSNHFISVTDRTPAFFTRWLLVEFPNSRIGLSGDAIDVDLAEAIIESEIEAISPWAMEGARRLTQRGHFITTTAHDRLMAKWTRGSNSLMEFLHDDEVVQLEGWSARGLMGYVVSRSDLFEAYVDWCRSSGRKPFGKQKVFEMLEEPMCQSLGLSVRRDKTQWYIVDGAQLRSLLPVAALGRVSATGVL
ncbi:hypothetical protein BH10PSE17_BH10PSE17_25180 [soil metagenome]